MYTYYIRSTKYSERSGRRQVSRSVTYIVDERGRAERSGFCAELGGHTYVRVRNADRRRRERGGRRRGGRVRFMRSTLPREPGFDFLLERRRSLPVAPGAQSSLASLHIQRESTAARPRMLDYRVYGYDDDDDDEFGQGTKKGGRVTRRDRKGTDELRDRRSRGRRGRKGGRKGDRDARSGLESASADMAIWHLGRVLLRRCPCVFFSSGR
ncbi:hypothetical protein FA13DRAFT_480658 [Coprinellus micaceus]|uniref:Uncharacterized protein n=1 Tax=Coprinellus micaceus TaxID=71717 RepID=A0A4Y7TAF9_COPMI|nr:hypothetical protein FA13DRAFT_480658 [Coprinellus micaceus]